ncbi:MAG: hypothetical protein SFW36_12000 [Leptolyngbyaceae cyanobacterium bins.59]|nr:hypothetical protein [Leptolyngbyaceae cyanobacterium bins.59]
MRVSLRFHSIAPLIPFTIACLTGFALSQLQVPQLNRLVNQNTQVPLSQMKEELKSERTYLMMARSTPTFGYENVIANWTFLRFLQYFGDDPARDATGYDLSPEYFEVILKLDPRFLQAYFYLSGSTSLYAGKPERTIALMSQGLAQISPQVPYQSYYIWRYKGIDELLFLGDSQAAQKSFEMAAKWADTYEDAESQQVAQFSRRTAEFLARNPKSKYAQVAAWGMFLFTALDERSRQIGINRIRALGGDVVMDAEGRMRIVPPKED